LGTLAGKYLAANARLADGLQPFDVGAIVQAACLTHDIGNPPFGHAGEYAIRDWFGRAGAEYLKPVSKEVRSDLQMFEGNAQGFRVVSQLEYNRFDGGMRLTCGTLASFVKYPWCSTSGRAHEKGKFGYFDSEGEIMREVAHEVGLLELEKNRWCRHPLAFLVEAADDICYAIIDLEDGMRMGVVDFGEFEDILAAVCTNEDRAQYAGLGDVGVHRRTQFLRGKAMDILVADVVAGFANEERNILAGELDGDLLFKCKERSQNCIRRSKDLARTKIFQHQDKMKKEIGAYAVLSTLLAAFCDACVDSQGVENEVDIPFRSRRIRDLMGARIAPKIKESPNESYRRVIDYIGGMTDDFATHVANQFAGVGRALWA
jgi:dGTPase